MNEKTLYPFIALLIPVLIGRFLIHQSLTKMGAEKKQEILDAVVGMQKIRFFSIFAIVGAIYFLPEFSYIIFPLLIIGLSWIYWSRVSKVSPPRHYTTAFFSSMVLGIIGIGAFLYLQQGKLF